MLIRFSDISARCFKLGHSADVIKLDDGQDVYVEKIRAWFDDAKINTLTVMIMEVPCCRGLSALARRALESATRKVPVKEVVVGIDGAIRQSEWLTA